MKKEKLVHGGDITGFRLEYGYEPLDFSANISPLGVPEAVLEAVREAAVRADRYPDPLCRDLREAISCQEDVDPEQIVCGNGAADVIHRLVRAVGPRRGMVTAPTFAEYREALEMSGCQVDAFLLKPDEFQVTERILDYLTPDLDILFLCEPNNPTGILTEPALLDRIMESCEENDILLVIDECFGHFLPDGEERSMKRHFGRYQNLFLLKAFTKIYGIPGIRLGYGLSPNRELIRRVQKDGPAWAVSVIAQEAGIAALKEEEYVKQVIKTVAEEREFLQNSLRELGLKVIPGTVNYLLLQGPEDLEQRLRRKGILVRNCDNYQGLTAGWVRIAVRPHEENVRLLESLKEVLA